ncbi:hypothetical protein BDD12DRAFT_837429 [Trichophaea hybrida]|nr:hypothetical protein BDD12DRAFT_837429 [Trichophaea hybrida]
MSSSYATSPPYQFHGHTPVPRTAWQHSAGQNPRSVPTPPISGHPTKKTRVTTGTPDPYYRNSSEVRETGPQNVTASSSRDEPRGLQPGYVDEAYIQALMSREDYYWNHERDGHSRRCLIIGNYSTKPPRAYPRQSATPPQDYEGTFSDSGDSRDAQTEPGTQHITRRSTSVAAYAEAQTDADGWNYPNVSLDAAGSKTKSMIAAQQVLTELFPELEDRYAVPSDPDRRASLHPSQYMSPPRRYSHAVDPNLNRSASPYRTSGVGNRSPSCSYRDDRPRGEYASAMSPESLYPLPAKSPTHLYSPSQREYTYQQSRLSDHEYTDRGYLDFDLDDCSDSEEDETDEDEDDRHNRHERMSAIPMSVSSPYESPERETYDPIALIGPKYTSSDINSSSSSAHPRSQNMRSSARKSTTSNGPRRPRKPIPNTETTTIAANVEAASEKCEHNDRMLVYYRKQGLSYKTIKTKLNLEEAESTLRGRYRTLTKPKNERLRKPMWSEEDVRLFFLSDLVPVPARNSTLHWSKKVEHCR